MKKGFVFIFFLVAFSLSAQPPSEKIGLNVGFGYSLQLGNIQRHNFLEHTDHRFSLHQVNINVAYYLSEFININNLYIKYELGLRPLDAVYFRSDGVSLQWVNFQPSRAVHIGSLMHSHYIGFSKMFGSGRNRLRLDALAGANFLSSEPDYVFRNGIIIHNADISRINWGLRLEVGYDIIITRALRLNLIAFQYDIGGMGGFGINPLNLTLSF